MSDGTNLGVLPKGNGEARIETLSPPGEPSPESLVVRMLFAPINPADLLVIDGDYAFQLAEGEPIGAEGVARVEKVGERVRDVAPGDLVLPLTRGNWCRSRVLPRQDIVRVPPGFDAMQAAMMRINPATARLLLDMSGVLSGDHIVQNGATSSVAHWVRLLARRSGVHVIDVGRRTADGVISADSEDFADQLLAASRGRPIRAAFDCVAGSETGRLAAVLAQDGQLIVYGHLSGHPCQIRSQLLTGRGLSVSGFSLRPAEARMERAAREAMFADLFAIAREERVCRPVKEVVPLEKVGEALVSARRAGSGRVLLDLRATSAP